MAEENNKDSESSNRSTNENRSPSKPSSDLSHQSDLTSDVNNSRVSDDVSPVNDSKASDMSSSRDITSDVFVASGTALSSSDSYDTLTVLERPVYSQQDFDSGFKCTSLKEKTLKSRGDDLVHSCCTYEGFKKRVVKLLPFLTILRGYKLTPHFVSDVIAGIVVGIVNIPQGMAYGLLSNLPPVYGLYVSFFPVLVYFFLGTSRHMAIGTFAVVSLMIAGVIDRAGCDRFSNSTHTSFVNKGYNSSHYGGVTTNMSLYAINTSIDTPTTKTDTPISEEELQCKLSVAVTVTFVAGMLQIAMGLLQLGFVNNYLSEPLTRGFTTGAALHVFTSQIKHILGIPTHSYNGAFKLIKIYVELLSNLSSINWLSIALSLSSIVVLVVFKEIINPRIKNRIKIPLPGELVVVVVTTAVVKYCNLHDDYDVRTVGEVPTGIPPPKLPAFSEVSGGMITDALSIAVVSFAISISLANLFATKNNYQVDSNQELLACGFSNTISSFFNCFMAAGSMSRSIIQDSVGGYTQVASLINCVIILIVMFVIGPLFQNTPNCALAAIIVVALKNMFLQVKDLNKLWFISRFDFSIWLVAFLSTALIDVDLGLLIALTFSLLTVVFRTQRPYTCILGRLPGTDIYRNVKVYNSVEEFPGVKIFRFESSLYYANSVHFTRKLYQKTKVDPCKVLWDHQMAVKRNQTTRHRKTDHQPERQAEEACSSEVGVSTLCGLTHVIIDCTTMAYIDWMGVQTLSKVIAEYKSIGVMVMLAGCKAHVRQMLEAAGFYKKISKECLFITLHDAVVASLTSNPQLQDQVGFERLCFHQILKTSHSRKGMQALSSM